MARIAPLSQIIQGALGPSLMTGIYGAPFLRNEYARPTFQYGQLGWNPSTREVVVPPIDVAPVPGAAGAVGPQRGAREFQGSPPLMYDQASQNRAMDMISGLIPRPGGWIAPEETAGMNQQDAPLTPGTIGQDGWASSPPVMPQTLQTQVAGETQRKRPFFGQQDEIPIQENQELMRQQPVQAQKKGLSDAAMWGLLSAGLGILQNNYGKYGQAGPAIGAGGMQGVNTYLGLRQQDVENQRRDMLAQQQGEYQRAQIEAQRANTDLQGRRVDLEEQRERQKSLQDLQSRNLALMLAGNDVEQQRIAVANPDKYLDFKVAQLKPEYKERSIKEGTQARDEYSIDGGKTWNPVPGGGKYDLRAAKGGSETNLTMQGAAEDFNKQSLKEQATALIKQYETLQNVPDQLAVMDEAEKALAAAGNFVGSGAEVKLGIAKFFNNNFGTNIGANEVANAELLRSTLFRQIMENLKKLDAQPSQQQQKVMQESLGNLTTDPKAIPNIIRITREVLTSRAKAHNKRARQAKENGAQFLYDITIPGFDEEKAPWE